MTRLSWRAALAALALLSPGVFADDKAPAGVWLIQPPFFDPLVEQGLVTPEFPVLVVKPDGRFTLYRALARCEPMPEPACRAALERSRADPGTLALVNAAGRWRAEGSSVEFRAEELGGVPDYFQRLLDDMRRDAKDDAKRREVDRLGRIFSTLYVLDGQPVKFGRESGLLHLQGGNPGDRLVYQSVDPARLQAALGLIGLAGQSVARYFRCLMSRPEDPQLAAIGRDAAAAFAATLRYESGELAARLQKHPAGAALARGSFGAYLGCPARDGR